MKPDVDVSKPKACTVLAAKVPCSNSARTPRNMTARQDGASTQVQLRDLLQPISLPDRFQSRVSCHDAV